MNLYDFLLALGFWQWLGVLMLAQALCLTVIYVTRAIFSWRLIEHYNTATWQTWNDGKRKDHPNPATREDE